jgi:hypothetical protein
MMPAAAAMLLIAAAALPAKGAASPSSRFDREKSSIEAGLQRWRGHVVYFDRKKDSWVCETNVTSGDKRIDRLGCAATATCYNRYSDEFQALLNMTGDIEAQHAAARSFYKKKWDCFGVASAPLVTELALRRVQSAGGERE